MKLFLLALTCSSCMMADIIMDLPDVIVTPTVLELTPTLQVPLQRPVKSYDDTLQNNEKAAVVVKNKK